MSFLLRGFDMLVIELLLLAALVIFPVSLIAGIVKKRRSGDRRGPRIWMIGSMTVIVIGTILVGVLPGGVQTGTGENRTGAVGTVIDRIRNGTTASVGGALPSEEKRAAAELTAFHPEDLPPYSGSPSVEVNGNVPFFTDEDLKTREFEFYSSQDSLGRCGTAYADICVDTMPVEERGKIGSVKPTGWHTVKYNGIDGNYLYNRCHLIGYQLAGENANKKNLITGTRYMNVEGMLPYENEVSYAVTDFNFHVLYRVTPVFEGNNLLASGVLMEAESVEDRGERIRFCVYCYNVQPGITIDYATGDSSGPEFTGSDSASGGKETAKQTEVSETPASEPSVSGGTVSYVVNTNTGRFHYPTCSSVEDIAPGNRMEWTGSRDELIGRGYTPCKRCNP